MSSFPSAPPAPVNYPSAGYPTLLLARDRSFCTGVTSNYRHRTVFHYSGGNFMRNQGQGSGALGHSPHAGAHQSWKGNTCVYC